ncbi:vitamin B12-dependent ribonucleotide reductase [Patescibacteria group bacterium]
MSRPEPKVTENALTVLKERYFKKDENRKPIENATQMFERIAENVAQADKNYGADDMEVKKTIDQFYELMASLDFMPNSPTLMNAGKPLQQLSACFVLPIEDDMESIFQAVKDTAMIHKSGGGTGFAFSRLRPSQDTVKKTGGVASGPISFMRVFNASTEEIKQGGTRRGANMGILRVDHPDILHFIKCKADQTTLNNFNISVAITEDFMKSVENNQEYDLINPNGNRKEKSLNARKVFDLIVKMAWKNGEPGIIFIDRMNKDNPTPKMGKIESTNPCGEQPLLPYESCNLGSINLKQMVKDGKISWDHLRKTVYTGVHFLDNVIDMNKYPIKEIEENTKKNRKIGLGVMGFAEMLFLLGISYNSEEGVKIGAEVMKFIDDEARKASEALAEKRGPFPNFRESIYKDDKPLRNATRTTIAPTGTISIIANCSSGVEPLFAISFVKNVMDNVKLFETNTVFENITKEKGIYSKELIEKIANEGGAVTHMDEIPEDLKKLFVVAHDVTPEWHIKMQAAFQKYTDNAVSKTVNFSNKATEEDIHEVYMQAYKFGCKGVTVYRDGSRDMQVLETKKTKKSNEAEKAVVAQGITPRKRPEIITGKTYKMKTSYGNLFITVNNDEKGHPFEIFTNIGKAGGFFAAKTEAISRLISLALRCGIKPSEVVTQLKGIRGPMPTWTKEGTVLSLADAIAKVIEKHLKKDEQTLDLEYDKNGNKDNENSKKPTPEEFEEIKKPKKSKESLADTGIAPECPECGGILEHEGGCVVCRGCGYSKCS